MNQLGTKVRNLRTTYTKESLVNAFFNLATKKDFEKITVADLTEGAQVNRATFYAHFNDKYDLLNYIMGNSASNAIAKRTTGSIKLDQESISQLVLAVCDFYQQPRLQCRQSNISLVIPQLKEKILSELKLYLLKSIENLYTDMEKDLFVSIYANVIHEAGFLWASGKVKLDKEEIAKKISLFVLGGQNSL
ncbi:MULTISPECIES: TetR/AcrR family transcriptional regulator [Paenibacillus]|uniref:TetR/AcrR family transcriptional regulator n=1 Tax=Paenibacillus TaxID=44249 RepID=UPI001E5D6F79|nr:MULTISPECIES: TetR/AcrR family transcriptional regulator [Paenibacillus]MCJ1219629.1 TetR/AcrR family transcriptional regulator [Paenibacillus polymyxa]